MQVYAIVGASGRNVSTEIYLCRRRSLAWKEAIPRGRMPPLEQEGTTYPRESSCRQRVNLEPRCLFGSLVTTSNSCLNLALSLSTAFFQLISRPPHSFSLEKKTNFLGAGKSFSTKTQRDQANSRSHEALEPWFVFSCFRKIT
ncbi:hypothetical protein GE21DRAFT_1211028 [Neurospora crassa]|nr:hypothetical protein 15E6.240 [imported] - Neurospora crassa [Neurospora crassa]KHE83453.1 hypothetical protein GE21DRAFT_1211028 [Neurospora crassa]